jgi:carbonic anhydrase
MKFSYSSLLACALGLVAASSAAATEHSQWSYRGKLGPAEWAALDPQNKLCQSGRHQSPVALNESDAVYQSTADIFVHYGLSHTSATNNGHTIQVDPAQDAVNTVSFKGKIYKLAQFHFHTPSEHQLDGKDFPMELHLVNSASDGSLLVIGVFIREGQPNKALQSLFEHLPARNDGSHMPVAVDIAGLLPSNRDMLAYSGSLTTPPCTENVQWLVMSHPIDLSSAQISAFKQLFGDDHRPLQPLNGREVDEEAML